MEGKAVHSRAQRARKGRVGRPRDHMRLLLVEDDGVLASFLREGLGQEGFSVDIARDGRDAFHQALHEPYDVIVLDILIPFMDGFEVLSQIRGQGCRVPVLDPLGEGRRRRPRPRAQRRRGRLPRQALQLLRADRAHPGPPAASLRPRGVRGAGR